MKNLTLIKQIPKVFSIVLIVILLSSVNLFADNPVSDNEISNAVDRQLILNSTTPSYLIDVETNEGIVTLSGTVNNLLANDMAVKVAQMVRGVRGVVDEISVDTPERNDSSLESDVNVALFNNPATSFYKIIVNASDGIVTLSGTVDSWQEKQLSEFIAKGVKGVKDITNDIEVSYKTDRSDNEIEEEIIQAMNFDVRIDNALINVAVDQGEVSLSGSVGSAAEKQHAIVKSWVAGVSRVLSDELEVNDWAKNENFRKEVYVKKTDEEIKQAIKDAFLYDPRVYSFNPEVSVSNGYVTLRGVVNNLQAKRAAENDARNVLGVFGVNNYLKVRPPDIPADSELEAEILKGFSRDPLIEKWQVNVSAINGIVYLSGAVDTYFEKSQAEAVASNTKGVVDVKNRIDVYNDYVYDYKYNDYYDWNSYYPPLYDITRPLFLSDTEIKNSIENELWWSPYVNESDVDVTVVNGTAILEGTVDSRREKLFAEINAIEGGAIKVENNLIVQF
jgi:osmotically-inducible protein OsmY